ncbi:hypothetical protein GCM10010971_35840 [Silvimonas amylolytica]|uniref:Uncharacterized protein n=1 Tax=Silvimonas amylolytica TaxID=449663 RepID=A0ABQ2PRA5_9NEIS|nr:hypothetical protein GCM10010971_35840 [Silvimonas amylolytica]
MQPASVFESQLEDGLRFGAALLKQGELGNDTVVHGDLQLIEKTNDGHRYAENLSEALRQIKPADRLLCGRRFSGISRIHSGAPRKLSLNSARPRFRAA